MASKNGTILNPPKDAPLRAGASTSTPNPNHRSSQAEEQRRFWETFKACLEAHDDIRTVQELLGHANVATTMIYTHVLNKPGLTVKSPADL